MSNRRESVISSLYDAVGNEAAWNGIVETLCEYLDANIGMLVVAGQAQRDQSFYASYNHQESVARAYSDHWWQHDIWLQTGLAQGLFKKGNIAIGADFVSTADLMRTAFYRDFLTTMPAAHLLVAIMSDGSDASDTPPMTLSFFRAPDATPFAKADLAALQLLYPHIHRAFSLHWEWRNMREQLGTFHTSLDRMDFGVMFIDSARRLRHANRAADTLASCILQPKLPTQGAVANLIDEAAKGRGGASVLETQRIMLLALPVSAPMRNPAGETRSSVMLLLVDPSKRTDAAADFMSNAFALSKAESRVVPLILQGKTPIEISEALGLKMPTVRSQLSNIFAKTGTTRQQELIRLLGTLPNLVEINSA